MIIETDSDIETAVRSLRARCAVISAVHDAVGTPALRRQPPGFPGLARIIVGQQLSVASAGAIWARCEQKLKPLTPERIARARETTLKSVGLSGPKIRTLRAVSEAALSGALPLERFPDMTDAEIHDALTAVKGIGPWTADIYLMFSLGRADAFAPGDLALQIAAQFAFGHHERPTPDALLQFAEAWRPWRAVSALLLWKYYAHVKSQKSAVPV